MDDCVLLLAEMHDVHNETKTLVLEDVLLQITT